MRGHAPKEIEGTRFIVTLEERQRKWLEASQKLINERMNLKLSLASVMRAAIPCYLHHLCQQLGQENEDPAWFATFTKLERERLVKENGLNPARIGAWKPAVAEKKEEEGVM